MIERDHAAATATSTGTSVMQAATIISPRQVEIAQVELPGCGPGQVRVRIEGCGVCASSLPVWEGRDWFDYPQEPGAPGHEGWGTVDDVGEGVEGLSVGDRVAILSYHAFAEYDLADAGSVVPLPESLRGKPFPGEPLGCAVNIHGRSDISPGQTVAIVGIGFLGALLTALASEAGARVIAIARKPHALEIARHFGAAATVEMDDHWRIIERVKELTGGEGCERVIEATGQQWPLDLAAELTKERGRLVIAGYHQDGPRQVNMQLWNWRGLDVINAHERDPQVYISGIREAVDLVARGRLDPSALYTHTYGLGELDCALDATRDRPENFMKALVMVR